MKSLMMHLFVGFVFSLLCGCVNSSKQCTNIPAKIDSKTVQADIDDPKTNATWKADLLKQYSMYTTKAIESYTAVSTDSLEDRRKLVENNWATLSKKLNNSAGYKPPVTLKEVSLHDVRITDPSSYHWQAQQLNLEYILMLEPDRLVWSFRQTAGLPTPGKPYGGWENPKKQLRGHFVGHYLSATALMWASTHNNTVKEKMTAVVSALAACQDKIGSGYLSAFPDEFFKRYEHKIYVWAPYYTMHKILAGLFDQYRFAGNEQALKMMVRTVEYFYKRVQKVISEFNVELHYHLLNTEVGGMSDVLYQLYSITRDQKHLLLAHLFDKPCFLGILALQADSLADFHSNTHIPHVIGAQMRYEVTGDPLYREMATYFMEALNSSHAYATGGTSAGEFWTDPKRLGTTLSTENGESCATHNMLKVARNLFRWTKEMTYADYYERALTNGVLGIQRRGNPGKMIYMLPLGRGVSKARSYHGWGKEFDDFWCCYGTGIESFSKLGDSIYFEEEGKAPGLYIIQYIPSSLDWKSGKISINQTVKPVVSWDSRLQVTFTISSKEKGASPSSTLNLRIPSWAPASGVKATLNGQGLPQPGKFLTVTRQWNSGDTITLELPLNLRTDALQDDRPQYATVKAILYGPYLLAGMTTKDWDLKTGNAKSLSDWITPIPATYHSNLISLSQGSGNSAFALANINNTISTTKLPMQGTNASVWATFRLILKDSAASPKQFAPKDAIGKLVMLEPFDFPGSVVVHQGANGNLIVAAPGAQNSVFQLVPGLNGKPGAVSLESGGQKGCFVCSGVTGAVSTTKLRCQSAGAPPDAKFKEEASFVLNNGISSYHPISFVAKGANRNFLLTPLYNFMDENYTVYFNITA
ncbi:uncharacterized protein LOC132314847 [Cornus florida]|uniref:uncharacterized protein LOC132314847 n=1 Tax=Cornus florida TaxID=4283 RepID=UPI00289C38E1|nr:uncharacterized protein LOC132314847 [Cornus florida]